jgi:hypothetical protein
LSRGHEAIGLVQWPLGNGLDTSEKHEESIRDESFQPTYAQLFLLVFVHWHRDGRWGPVISLPDEFFRLQRMLDGVAYKRCASFVADERVDAIQRVLGKSHARRLHV